MRLDRVRFAAALARRDITINELAHLSGLSRNTISGVKAGRRCSTETGEKIASALCVKITDLLEEEGGSL